MQITPHTIGSMCYQTVVRLSLCKLFSFCQCSPPPVAGSPTSSLHSSSLCQAHDCWVCRVMTKVCVMHVKANTFQACGLCSYLSVAHGAVPSCAGGKIGFWPSKFSLHLLFLYTSCMQHKAVRKWACSKAIKMFKPGGEPNNEAVMQICTCNKKKRKETYISLLPDVFLISQHWMVVVNIGWL